MTYPSVFRTPEGEAAFLAAYDAALKVWAPVRGFGDSARVDAGSALQTATAAGVD